MPDGTFEIGAGVVSDHEAFASETRQRTFNFAVTLFPRLTLAGHGVVADDENRGRNIGRDVSASAQLLVIKDGAWWPGVAVGIADVGGASNFFRTYYVAASKTLFGSLRLTAGLGRGPDVLKGPFGGVEFKVNPLLTVLGEYDGKYVTPAVRLFPLPEKLERKGIPRPTVDVLWNEGKDVQWQVALRGSLGGRSVVTDEDAEARALPHHERRRDDGASAYTIVREIQADLTARGLENVRVSLRRIAGGRRITIEYENRRWNRDELDAVGIVLGVALARTAADVTELRAIVKEVNIPVLAITTDAAAFRAYLDEELTSEELADELRFVQDGTWLIEGTPPEASTDIAARSWAKLDVFARPRVETQAFTEVGTFDARMSVLPDAYTQLLPGMVVNVQGVIPIAKTNDYVQPLGTPGVERVLVHQAVPIPLGRLIPTTAAMTQVSVGRFTRDAVGLQHEVAVSVLNGLGFLKTTWSCLGTTYAHLSAPRYCMALANARVRWPALNAKVSVTAGRFLDGDKGVSGDVSRFFGDTEIGVFLRHSELGNLAGIRIALPLTPSKELRPWVVRPRLPEVYSYEQRTVVFEATNVLRTEIGRELETNHAIEDVYWNRDRLYPAYVRQHVETLRDAVRDWVDEDSEHASARKDGK